MNTEQLVERLAGDLRPVPSGARARRLGLGILGGCIVTLGLVVFGLGPRPDLAVATRGADFWMKWAYTFSLALGAAATTARLARPEAVRLTAFWPLALPVVVLAVLGGAELWQAPARERLAMWLGATWKVCPWLVLGLSGPIFLGLLWSFRRMAPTRLRAAGAAAGLTAGAWAATLYCLHCPETSALFVLTWYTLGMLLAATVGAIVGPKLLRW